MAQFKIPASPTKYPYQSSEFLGADFTSESSTVSEDKSPNVVNMIRSVPGKIRKRMGYHEIADYGETIYGVHKFTIGNEYLVHAGTKLYLFMQDPGREWVDDHSTENNIVDTKEPVVKNKEISVNNHTYYQVENAYYRVNKKLACEFLQRPGDVAVVYIDFAEPQEDAVITVKGKSGKKEYTSELHPPYKELDLDGNYTSIELFGHPIKLYDANEVGIWHETWIEDEARNNIMFLTGNKEDNVVYIGMAEHRSVSFQLGHKLVILDGTSVTVYDGTETKRLTEAAYIPTLTISKDPDGGGTDFEPLNLLSPAFVEEFIVESDKADTTEFQMTFGELDDTEVEAWVLDEEGEWQKKKEGEDFTVDRDTGLVTFLEAPGETPIVGEDNVSIKAYRTVEGYANRINHCTIGILFGVNGANDRLFVSGNPDMGENKDGELYSFINYDWFSQQYDPTYFGDTWYAKLGADSSAIMGYSIINNYLATHKDYHEEYQSVLIREGNLVEGQPSFKLINTLQGTGAISKYAFSYLATEPVFLSSLGIYAITAQDVTGEKYAQNRSYYLEGKLLAEPGLEDAHSISWKDYYILAINDHLYILDGLQPIRTDRSRPYATRQYAGFYFENVPASALFTIDNELYFGTTDGKIMKWYTEEKDTTSYNDNGEPITCVWETSDISEKHFYKNKTYRYIAVRCPPEITSSIQIWAQKNGIWEMIKEDHVTLKYISFQRLTFSTLSFSTNKTQRVTASKMRLKKLDHARFRFKNDVLNEPLGINDYAIEFTQAGNRK